MDLYVMIKFSIYLPQHVEQLETNGDSMYYK